MRNPAKLIQESMKGSMPALVQVLGSFDAALQEQLEVQKEIRDTQKEILNVLVVLNGNKDS